MIRVRPNPDKKREKSLAELSLSWFDTVRAQAVFRIILPRSIFPFFLAFDRRNDRQSTLGKKRDVFFLNLKKKENKRLPRSSIFPLFDRFTRCVSIIDAYLLNFKKRNYTKLLEKVVGDRTTRVLLSKKKRTILKTKR